MLTHTKATAIQILQNALALHDTGRIAEAVQLYEAAQLQLQNLGHFWHFYGLALFQLGAGTKATDCFRRSLLLAPADANCINRFACVFLADEHTQNARQQFRHALVITPDHPEAWRNIAETQRIEGQTSSARTSLEKAIALRPEDASWRLSHIAVLNDLERPDEALASLRILSKASSPSPEYFFQEARALFDAYKASRAINSYRKALALSPGAAQALNNLQTVEATVYRMRDAVKSATRARVLEPGNIDLEHGLANALLSAGDIKHGQALNFWRHMKPEIQITRLGLPEQWDGAPSRNGEGLLICCEQGIGDEIRFASCIPDIQKRFEGPLFLETDKRLVPLFSRSFPDVTVVEKIQRSDSKPATAQYGRIIGDHGIDWYIMLGDLPSIVRTSLASFPDKAGYLAPDANETERWNKLFRASNDRPAVGISWRSGMRRHGARHNYPEAEDIVPLLEVADFLAVNLQYDVSDLEIATLRSASGRHLFKPPGIDQRDELDRVAAMIAALDLVISPNTSVLMMAGAVGTPSIGLHSWGSAAFFGAKADPWFPAECSLVKTGDRSWGPLVKDAIPHLQRMLSELKCTANRPSWPGQAGTGPEGLP